MFTVTNIRVTAPHGSPIEHSDWIGLTDGRVLLPDCCDDVTKLRAAIRILYIRGFGSPFDCKTFLYRYITVTEKHFIPKRYLDPMHKLAIHCRGEILQ